MYVFTILADVSVYKFEKHSKFYVQIWDAAYIYRIQIPPSKYITQYDYKVGQQYSTYGNSLRDLVKRSKKNDKSTLRPVNHANAISIDNVGSENGIIDPFGPFSHTSTCTAISQAQAGLCRPSVNTRGPEIDPKVLVNTLTFYSAYRGYCVAGNVKSKKAVGGYSVSIQRRTAILVSVNINGVVILSNDDGSLQYRISWREMADFDHVHTDNISTPLRKRKRTNYLALRLKDGSVYEINSLQTPELFTLVDKYILTGSK